MTNNNNIMNSPRSRPEIFSLLAVTMFAAVLVHQPATVYCADGGIYSSQQKQQQQQQQQTMMFTAPSGYYVSTYDNLDVGQLLRNQKVVSSFFKCFVNEGPCTPDGKLVKAYLLPEIIRTVCGKCTPRQKDMARQVLRYIYTHRRADFDKIMLIYDTDNKKNEIINFMNQ
ncbi:ejaculatory bulb-specific protein 3-like [Metopolophium dirhodum]|uniref:ejaculatory bulb-specific protein 3-like n=1 Tax=Metopolophium dirhodum TaxID=44670 RepID=UPI002990100A|nr:ejaculatory bulb-specific protein 3-like [Metopolophium dirhodum]